MMRKTIFLLLSYAVLLSCQRPGLTYGELEKNILSRLKGTWQAEGQTTYEVWSRSGDSVYHALVYSLEAGEVQPKETIRILEDDGDIFYEATVNGQNEGRPIRFALTAMDSSRMVFSNPGHDFPKNIEYRFLNDQHLVATVGDGEKKDGKSFIIHYQRIMKQKKVTGIGGIFFRSKDPEKMREWYRENLGLITNEYGSLFEFRKSDEPDQKAYLQWSPFSENTNYFEPSDKQFMINYRVENLEWLVEELRKAGVTILDTIETYEYGKFVHILDPENNKIELWEPVDNEFTRSYEGQTTK